MRTLITGASGFVGSALLDDLAGTTDWQLRAAYRNPPPARGDRVEQLSGPDLGSPNEWTAVLADVDVVIHSAARVHVMKESASDPRAEFRRINRDGTLRLAKAAARAGVRRFVFLSTIKVNGEETPADRPFSAEMPAMPSDPYGISKWEAEQGLREIARSSAMEVVAIRPVLVYGPHAKGNFATMVRAVNKGIPLPLGSLHNRRSMVAIENLIDLIKVCVIHGEAANQTFLVSDGLDLSVVEMLRIIGDACGKPARLIPVAPAALRWAARLTGQSDVAQRLCGSLRVDISKNRRLLGWQPPLDARTALARTVQSIIAQPPA